MHNRDIVSWIFAAALSVSPGVVSPLFGAQSSQPIAPHPQVAIQTAPPAASASTYQRFDGKVVETMNAAGYTYVRVDTGTQKLWAAAPQFEVKVGDSIKIEEAMPMPKYHSKTLNRDFDVVYFTGRALVNGAQPKAASTAAALPQGHPPVSSKGAPADNIDLTGIKKAEGGKSIAEIFASRSQLAGKKVKVRGKVVKYNAMIMGKNWIHLQDGSGATGSNDLTLTTQSEAKVGAIVLATGTIQLDKDFGHGYKYSILLEDATLVVEPAVAKK